MTRYARRERAALADELERTGPDAPTLCAGWTARDLAAHVVVRERRPHAAVGVAVPPLKGLTERVQAGVARRPYDELVRLVRTGPPSWSPLGWGPLDEASGLVEFAVHTEDVRRAQEAWQPRVLDADEQERLWARLRGVARLSLRRAPGAVTLRAPGREPLTVGAGEEVVVAGEPLELLLWTTGRTGHAQVELRGDAGAVARLRGTRLTI